MAAGSLTLPTIPPGEMNRPRVGIGWFVLVAFVALFVLKGR